MGEYYDYLRQKAYFARILFRDEDKDCLAPIYVKVPESVLEPDRDMKILLEALEELYDIECLVAFYQIREDNGEPKIVLDEGMASNILLVVTTWIGEDEAITGVITPQGEYELLCFDADGPLILATLGEEVVESLGLEYVSNATDMRRDWLNSIDSYYKEDNVYLPHFLYD